MRQRKKSSTATADPVFDAWTASRRLDSGVVLVPGAHRPLSVPNVHLAWFLAKSCSPDFFFAVWSLNPLRTTLMLTLNVVRSVFPAFRGYSQALIFDELQSLIGSHRFTWTRLVYLLSTEIVRRVVEGMLDSFATTNENIVLGSARFYLEYKQMERRVRLDVPTLADPAVTDLLRESEMFSQSIAGGFSSPLEFLRIISLLTEIVSHLFLLLSITRGASELGVLALSIVSIVLPIFLSWVSCSRDRPDTPTSLKEQRAAEKQMRLRNLVYQPMFRPEISLFGLGDWILKSWSSAMKVSLGSQPDYARRISVLDQFNLNEVVYAVQNIPFLLMSQHSVTSLGSLTAYRSSIHGVISASTSLMHTTRFAFQGIFLMSAFVASMRLKPKLNPRHEDTAQYISTHQGVTIEAKGLSYTYPNSTEPALRNVTFSLKAGESLAIVGFNGSGKSTLARILLRIVDYDDGSLRMNDTEVRRYHPDDYHSHVSAVFQGFAKFPSTVKENVGLGNVDKISYKPAIDKAVRLAGAETVIESLPYGLKTTIGPDYTPYGSRQLHDLSGGEWQRIALARAFMRANEPEVDLLLFDEPTSALDAHAQNQIFETLDKISRSPSGERNKTVIFITHRLSTARRADKVAMMENGTISEFGTHDELLAKNGSYASLYRASI